MAQFSDLPVDLLPCILDFLSFSEYNSLVRVSKSLNKATTSYLYRDIYFFAYKSRQCARNLAFLLRTLLERPELSCHVRTFRLLGPHACWSNWNPWKPDEGAGRDSAVAMPRAGNQWGMEGCTTLSKMQMLLSCNQFYNLVDSEMHKNKDQFSGRSKDALAILALTRFTELTTLEIGEGFMAYSLFLPQILKRADRLFPKLDHVILGDRKRDNKSGVSYMDLELIRPIFYLPSVRTFEWCMTEPWRFSWNRTLSPCSERLTKLCLFRSHIKQNTLSQLLFATPRLTSFQYEYTVPDRVIASGHAMTTPFSINSDLNHALHNVASSLEEVKIALRFGPSTLSDDHVRQSFKMMPLQGTLMVLKSMKNLVKVNIPIVMGLGWWSNFAARLEEILPPSVEEVVLRDDFVKYCPWAIGEECHKKLKVIGEYIQQRSVYAPRLRSFKIQIRTGERAEWLFQAVENLRAPVYGEDVTHRLLHEKNRLIYAWDFVHEKRGGS